MSPKLPPYDHDHENEVMPFAVTNFRNQQKEFGIKTDDRRRHVYVIGKTGMGKSTLLENMFLHDVNAGHGCCYVDPHGETAKTLTDFIPPSRINDVVYFNPSDIEYPMGFNIFEVKDENQKHLVAAGLMAVFKKIWEGVWSSRMEYILLNTVLALLDAPGSTLLGINRLLSDEDYRKRVVSLIQDPIVKTFWIKEFAAFSDKYRTEAVAPVQNKVGQFLSASIIRNIVAQVKSTINLREIMDNRKILILNLSKGLIGEENSRLLGAMIITRLQLAAMERVDMAEEDRQDFYLYVDEFQNFATESFAAILSEARKYRLSLTMAHQYIEQLDDTVKAAVFGNVGTIIAMRVGSPDAAELVKEFTPRFTEEDLVGLSKYEIYLKLMIDGAASEPFSANTLPPIAKRTNSSEKVIKVSRERHSTRRDKIEEKVVRWSGVGTVDEGGEITTEEEKDEKEGKDEKETSKEKINEEDKELEEKIKALQASSPKIPELVKTGKKKKPQFEMPCSVCGKISQLNFEPDKSRPWFCKEHLEERQKAMGEGRPVPSYPPRSTAPPPSAPPPSVSSPAKEITAESSPPKTVGLSALSQTPQGSKSASPRPVRSSDSGRPTRSSHQDRRPSSTKHKTIIKKVVVQNKFERPKPPPIRQAAPIEKKASEPAISLSALSETPPEKKEKKDYPHKEPPKDDDKKPEKDDIPKKDDAGKSLKPGQVVRF